MVVAKMVNTDTNKEIIVIGLSEKDVWSLREGLVLAVPDEAASGCLPPGHALHFFYGASDEDMFAELRARGLINETTRIERHGGSSS